MPQGDTPPDFAALWAEYKQARLNCEEGLTEEKFWLRDEIDAARALLDALANDRTLHRLNANCLAAMELTTQATYSHATGEEARRAFISEAIQARQALYRIRRMGLLHGPEEVQP